MTKRQSIVKRFIFLVGICIFTVSFINVFYQPLIHLRSNALGVSTKSTKSHQSSSARPAHPLKFFERESFFRGIAQAETENYSFPSPITGGIIPHHLLPSYMIGDFFRRLALQKPHTIVLVGPNHHELGNYPGLSSLYNWQTPFGDVEPETSLIEDLVVSDMVRIDEEVAENEHSVAGIMPFIKYYLPEVRVVPLIVSGRMNYSEIEALAKVLTQHMTGGIVMVASVDFSHYLPSHIAYEKDRETLEIIKNFDYRRLMAFNNDYLDSPSAIAILLMMMQLVGKTNMQEVSHTNSGEIMGDSTIPTTSYFSLVFY